VNDDTSRHWLTYPNPKTPEYIIDSKRRLGQLKNSSTLGRPMSASTSIVYEQQEPIQTSIVRPATASPAATEAEQHHFLTFERRATPDGLRAARHRLDKHRYHPSLDNYPPRPAMSAHSTNEHIDVIVANEVQQAPSWSNTNVWVADDDRKGIDNEQTPVVIQMMDCDNFPPEYANALDTANVAQEHYRRSRPILAERRPDSAVYYRTTVVSDQQSDSSVS
jgi:hypothetical protein